MKVINPLTGKKDAVKISEIPTSKIIDLYNDELNMNVQSYFEGIEKISLIKCTKTNFLFFSPNVSGNEEFYDKLKVQLPLLYNTPYYCEWKWEYDIALGFITPEHKVLEIGCGNGYFLQRLVKMGIDANGLELNYTAVKEAVKSGLKVLNSSVEDYSMQDEKYDIICTFQVLEHVFEVKSFIESCLKILKKDGLLIIAVPNNNPYLFKNDLYNTLNLPPHHLGLWNKRSFLSLPAMFNMRMKKIIVEKLPKYGYDFERYFVINKFNLFHQTPFFNKIINKFYYRYLKVFHSFIEGKNIVSIYEKI